MKWVQTNYPFCHNYLFSKDDIDRKHLSRWHLLWLWMYPTFTQVSEGHAFHYKMTPNGRIWLIKHEEIKRYNDLKKLKIKAVELGYKRKERRKNET